MKKLGKELQSTVSELGEGSDSAHINMRVQQVRQRYRQAIESIYKESAPLHLTHTNNVFIIREGAAKTLIVYVDDSLFAAELNAQRELVKLKMLELFGEDISEFHIRTSGRQKYRDMHPYNISEERLANASPTSVSLDQDDVRLVEEVSSKVQDEALRKSLRKAMTADIKRKKASKGH